MGLARTDIFTDNQNELASIAKLFSNPARVAVLQYLFKVESCICGDIVEEIGLAQPTVSQHLKELRTMGLIKGDVDGTTVCYCIDRQNWNTMKEKFGIFLNQDLNLDEECC